MRYLTVGAGYVVVYALVGWALGGHPFARAVFGNIGVVLPAAGVAAVILRRRQDWAGSQRLFWDMIAVGMALWMIGHAGWVFDDMVRRQPTWLHWHTLFSLCGSICPLIALLARPHRGVRAPSVPAVGFDIASYGMLVLFIYAYFVLIPSLGSNESASEVALFTLIQANRLLLLLGMLAFAWAARRSAWRGTYLRFALGVGIGFFARIVTSLAIVRGTYESGTLYDLAWLGPWICYGWAAVGSPSSDLEEQPLEVTPQAPSAVLGAIPVCAIPLIGYTALHAGSVGAAGEAFRGLLTSVVTVAGLGLLTLRLAAQGGELVRTDARLKLLAAATEQTRDLILIVRADGVLEHANDAFLRALGYARSEIGALRLTDTIAPGFDTLVGHVADAVRSDGVWRGTILRRRRDGSTFPASCTVVALRDANGVITHFVGVERDVTEELTVRDQLVHSERLSAVAELVAGVAHEINNPLQTIIGAVELLLEEPSVVTAGQASGAADSATAALQRRDLELVRREAARAGQIVRNLLSFIRKSAPDRTTADLNHIVRTTVDLRRYHLQQRNIETTLECDPSPLLSLVNREEIQQVVLNLLLNAEQAITAASADPECLRGGRITVVTRAGTVNTIEIADDGPGVTPEVRGRIFEPFFTTKEVGEGTGLGLSISHGIVSAHGGSLELCPSAFGACFRLTLPAADCAERT